MPDDNTPDITTPTFAGTPVPLGTPSQGGAQVPQPNTTPGIISLIQQLAKPTGQVQGPVNVNTPPPAPSRASAFENFLGQFVNSLAAGMSQSGHGPGANERGAAGAIQAPYQQSVQRFGLQQQAAANQAQIQETQARTQQAQAETAAIPQKVAIEQKQLVFNEQIKQLQMKLENEWRQAMVNQGQQKIDVTKSKEAFTEQIKQQQLNLQKQIQTGKLNIAQEISRYRGMDVASQVAYRAAMASMANSKLQIAYQAQNTSNTLKTAQAAKAAVSAANDYNFVAKIARSIGIDGDLGMPMPDLQIPNVVVPGQTNNTSNKTTVTYSDKNPFAHPKK